ncbi:MAG: MFS transporter [Anaerolineae bacterium]
MKKYTVIWFGQMLSMFGTAATRFALLIWAYQQTGKATPLALLGFFSFILFVLASPFAGVIVDRVDRRKVMVAADLGSAGMTAIMLILLQSGQLQLWHLYLAEALTGVFDAFQIPAYHAATSLLVPQKHYGRASGMSSFAQAAAQVFAPAFAPLLLNWVGLHGVMTIDILTFFVGITPLIFIAIPHPMVYVKGNSRPSIRKDLSTGFRYIFDRPGLVGLIGIYSGISFAAALTYFAILAPLVLARTGGDEVALGSVQAAMGVGGLIGGVVMSIWGGPKRRIHGVLLVCGVSFLIGDFLMAVGRTTSAWMFAILIATIFVPIIVGSKNAIWQSKVEPAMQGRVFAVRNLFETGLMPIGYLIAGPLADHVFEPAMQQGGNLASVFGGLLGTGSGAGMGFMFLCTCIMGTAICLSGYLFPAIRHVEDDLVDHVLQHAPIPEQSTA